VTPTLRHKEKRSVPADNCGADLFRFEADLLSRLLGRPDFEDMKMLGAVIVMLRSRVLRVAHAKRHAEAVSRADESVGDEDRVTPSFELDSSPIGILDRQKPPAIPELDS